jgi:hypothetical protein
MFLASYLLLGFVFASEIGPGFSPDNPHSSTLRALAPGTCPLSQLTRMQDEDHDMTEMDIRLSKLIRHMRHPVKDGLLTLAGDEDCDIPELCANFVFGAAEIDSPDVSDSN